MGYKLVAIVVLSCLLSLKGTTAIDKVAQFNAYDADGDGKWSRKEADYVLYMKNNAGILEGKGFDGLDKNSDGGVDEDEYNQSKLKTFLVQQGAKSGFTDIDTDDDEYIMVMEYIKAVSNASKKKMDTIFAQADANHDRFISQSEFSNTGALVDSVCLFPCDAGDV